MLAFDAPSHRFHLRAAAILIHEGAVLLHRADGDSFWTLPGGRVEAGETAAAAVARELLEELAITAEVDKLRLLVESFFTHQDRAYHEVGFYFDVQVAPTCHLLATPGPYQGRETDRPLTFAWFPLTTLATLDLRPVFLAAELVNPEQGPRHLVHRMDAASIASAIPPANVTNLPHTNAKLVHHD